MSWAEASPPIASMSVQSRPALDTAPRILAGDDRTRYDAVAITLHWLTVFLVLANLGLALLWEDQARPVRHLMQAVHMSFGALLTVVVLTRIVWRLIPGHQTPPAAAGWMELASKLVHYLLYALLIASAMLGFTLRWSGDEDMVVFGLLIPPPFPPFPRPVHHLVGEAHEWIGWSIVVLAGVHAAAALYHHYVLKDRVLGRMLPWRSR